MKAAENEPEKHYLLSNDEESDVGDIFAQPILSAPSLKPSINARSVLLYALYTIHHSKCSPLKSQQA